MYFGTLPTTNWRGVRGRENGLLRQARPASTRELTQNIENAKVRGAAQFFSPAFRVEAPGYGIAPPPSMGSAVSSLSGLGLVNVAWCDSFEQAIETLAEVVRRGEAAGFTSANFIKAKELLEAETGYNPTNRTPVWKGNCEAQTARIVVWVNAVNAELASKGASWVPSSGQPQPAAPVPVPPVITENFNAATQTAVAAGKPPEEMSDTAKFAIIGGISVVGAIALAVIVTQVVKVIR